LFEIALIAVAAGGQQGAPAPAGPPDEEIVVTASREPVRLSEAPASATVFAEEELERLGLPIASDLLRLVPGVSVANTGPHGSQTQLRIRGAEANHTLLFVDGIRFNDPAAGNEARFELLTADALSRLEVVRGPQSALWGSEALGGVVAVEGPDPFTRNALSSLAEYGSLGSSRLGGQFAARAGDLGLSGSGGWIRSEGIDSFGSNGERDGFDNRQASLRAVYRPGDDGELGIVGHWVEGESEFDGLDPVTFRRADTLDVTDNRIFAVRGWGSAGHEGWSADVEASLLDSENRNRLGNAPLNSTFGRRFTAGLQLSRRIGGHRFTAAAEHEGEDFSARDQVYFGGTDQNRSRSLTALVGQWHARWSDALVTDVAVRHDSFSEFADATTFRAALLFRPARQWTLHAAYGEGIAQPTFYDLYGFFPGSFAGNAALRPESSRGWEAGVRWENERASVGVTGFRASLEDEIIDVFDPATFLGSTENAADKSRRLGVEVEGSYRLSTTLVLGFNYTFLDAEQQQSSSGAPVREVRRPRHSANLIAGGEAGRLSWGASLAYVGERTDTDFDVFPAQVVTLDDYVLASLRVGWRITPALEACGRVENGFDADYQDVVGYNTQRRTVYAGIRLRLPN
jgi:vitamin B12 transporter